MDINGVKVFKYSLPSNISYKLKNKIGIKYKDFYELTKPDKQHLKQRMDLITKLIGRYAINKMIFKTRFYYSAYLKQRIKRLMNYKPSDLNNNSIGDVIKNIQSRGIKVFLHGGLIRDMFMKIKSYDIDIIFDSDVNKIKLSCDELNLPCSEIMPHLQYINFGSNKGSSLEGSNLGNTFLNDRVDHEASINDFAYDLQNDVLIDLTGFGLEDILNKVVRLSAKPDEWMTWAERDFKRPLRYFKLIQKGFRPYNNKIHNFVIKYIEDNYDSLYDKKINPSYPVKRIKHFIIKTITQGEIDTKNKTYTFGPTKSKLIPYLLTLKKEFNKELFVKIMAMFTEEDLKQFKALKLLSTISNYKSDFTKIDKQKSTQKNKTHKVKHKKNSSTKIIKTKKTKN